MSLKSQNKSLDFPFLACPPKSFEKLIVISDCHLGSVENDVETFSRFLDYVREEHRGCDIVLLGDFFHIWAVEPIYRSPSVKQILDKLFALIHDNFHIYLIIGNRDFLFKAVEYNPSPLAELTFHSICPDYIKLKSQENCEVLFHHGDLLNSQDKQYLRWRRLIRSLFAFYLLKGIPASLLEKWARNVEEKLKTTNQVFRRNFPQNEWQNYREYLRKNFKFDLFFCGHYHPQTAIIDESSSQTLCILPAWQVERKFLIIEGKGDYEIKVFEKSKP